MRLRIVAAASIAGLSLLISGSPRSHAQSDIPEQCVSYQCADNSWVTCDKSCPRPSAPATQSSSTWSAVIQDTDAAERAARAEIGRASRREREGGWAVGGA